MATKVSTAVVKGKCHQQVASIIPCTAVASKSATADSGSGGDDGSGDGIFSTVTVDINDDLSAT